MKLLSQIIFHSKSLLAGKSLARSLQNEAIRDNELSGEIIDLGSGNSMSSYNRYLKYKEPYKIIRTDYFKTSTNTIKLDLEKPFKLGKKFDFAICMNALEHI